MVFASAGSIQNKPYTRRANGVVVSPLKSHIDVDDSSIWASAIKSIIAEDRHCRILFSYDTSISIAKSNAADSACSATGILSASMACCAILSDTFFL